MLRDSCPIRTRGSVDHGSWPNTLARRFPWLRGFQGVGLMMSPQVEFQGPSRRWRPLVGPFSLWASLEAFPTGPKKTDEKKNLTHENRSKSGPKNQPASKLQRKRHKDETTPVVVKNKRLLSPRLSPRTQPNIPTLFSPSHSAASSKHHTGISRGRPPLRQPVVSPNRGTRHRAPGHTTHLSTSRLPPTSQAAAGLSFLSNLLHFPRARKH